MNLRMDSIRHANKFLGTSNLYRGQIGRRSGFAKAEQPRSLTQANDIGGEIRKHSTGHTTRLTKDDERFTKRFWLGRVGNINWAHCFETYCL